ncbi:MAG: 4Fe-4S dicluster domain-containing protein, partial [Patescibacteria group bacterium]
MKKTEIFELLAKLLDEYVVFAPQGEKGAVRVGKIEKPEQVDWSGEMPQNSFKSIFLPPKEELFSELDGVYKETLIEKNKTIAFGMNVLDLQAYTLFDHVFEKDVYYQKRKQNTFVVGLTGGVSSDLRKYKVFHQTYEENVLEHLMFDVFLERHGNGDFTIFSGSERGQKLLEKNNIKDYENIEFSGLVPEQGIDPRLLKNRQAIELNEDHPLWDELADICLACGKCSMVCPTCFCFDEVDEAELDGTKKSRQWSSCFYPEFSKVCGGEKELYLLKKRLYFWYQHKFVRIPDELSYYGCVSCMRCFKVCPVGI